MLLQRSHQRLGATVRQQPGDLPSGDQLGTLGKGPSQPYELGEQSVKIRCERRPAFVDPAFTS